MDQIIPCAIVTGCICSAYLARDRLQVGALWGASKLIELYIDLKWYLGDARPATTQTPSISHTVTHLPSDTPYCRYLYREREYITFGELPSEATLRESYDHDERITTVIVVGDKRVQIEPDHSLYKALTALAGPLCDFHGDTTNILSYLTSLDVDLDTDKVIRIVVNTENFQEYVLEPASQEVHLHQD